jgi:hypothetical protein
MFTHSTVTHVFQNADGTAASGSVEFTLEQSMTNGGVTIVASTHVSAMLDGSGNLIQQLVSTEDPDTFSQGVALWRADERIAGAPSRTHTFAIASGGISLDYGNLISTPQTYG